MTDPAAADHSDLEADTRRRQRWMGVIARSPLPALSQILEDLDDGRPFHVLRPAEHGLVMVRARAGGSGQLFNAGEMTVTRCAVKSASGTVGHGYVAGRSRRHAEIAARLDALLQRTDTADAERIVDGLEQALTSAAEARYQKSAPTKVDFFTMVRGENA